MPAFLCIVAAISLLAAGRAQAAGLNTDVALTPPEGGSIIRLQWRYSEAAADRLVRDLHAMNVVGTYIYGLKANTSLFWTVPYGHRDADVVMPRFGRVERQHDGVGDVKFLLKYRFWQQDVRPQETRRWAAITGLDIRSGDRDFSSDSYDPIIGTVFTWQRDRNWFDADLVYQFNTGRDVFRHDGLRYDLAYTYRLFPTRYPVGRAWAFNLVGELNGSYRTDDRHEVFLAPGLQLMTERVILEASIQLPVIQDLPDGEPETEYRLVLGLRFQF